jgi:hypothetical protein
MDVNNVALLLFGLTEFGNAFGGCNALDVTIILPFVFPLLYIIVRYPRLAVRSFDLELRS